MAYGKSSIDNFFKWFCFCCAGLIGLLMLGFFIQLSLNSKQVWDVFGWRFLISTEWDPVAEKFGALPSIVGTLCTTLIALIIALPLALAAAMFFNPCDAVDPGGDWSCHRFAGCHSQCNLRHVGTFRPGAIHADKNSAIPCRKPENPPYSHCRKVPGGGLLQWLRHSDRRPDPVNYDPPVYLRHPAGRAANDTADAEGSGIRSGMHTPGSGKGHRHPLWHTRNPWRRLCRTRARPRGNNGCPFRDWKYDGNAAECLFRINHHCRNDCQ